MKLHALFSIILILIQCSVFAQQVILYDDFEAATNWRVIGSGTNQWYQLGGIPDAFGSTTTAFAISEDGVNYEYDISSTSEASVFITPNWPSSVSNFDITLQFDLRVRGEDFLGFNVDYLSVSLVDLDPDIIDPVPANLNGSNSVTLTELNLRTDWDRIEITLNNTAKTFLQDASNDVLLVFSWQNNNIFGAQPPACFDNVLITSVPVLNTALAGEYEVGLITGNDFPTITQAISYLNNNGISSDVTFYLTDLLYDNRFETFPLEIGDGNASPFTGAGIHSITFKPDDGVTSVIEKEENIFGADINNHGTFTLWGIDNVILDGANTDGGTSQNLTIVDNSVGSINNSPIAIYVAGIGESTAQSNVQLRNLNIATSSPDFGYGILIGQHTTVIGTHFKDEALFDNISISNNNISSALEAIHVDGADRNLIGGYNGNSLVTNLLIADNTIASTGSEAIEQTGIHILGANMATISDNQIGNFNQNDLNSDVGIIVDQVSRNVTIEKNDIFNLGFNGDDISSLSAHAIDVYTGLANSNVVIKNNVIRQISGNGASSYANAGFLNPVSIFLGQGGEVGVASLIPQSGFSIANNSFYMFGEEMDFLTSVSMVIALASNVTDVSFINNLVNNSLGGSNTLAGNASALVVFAETDATQFSDINYNGYYVDANSAFTNNYIGLIGALSSILGASSDMNQWRVESASEFSSQYGNPAYTSQSNLIPDNTNESSWIAQGTGAPLSFVDDDFNDVARSTTIIEGTTDLGAFEFSTDTVSTPPPTVTYSSLATGVEYDFEIFQRNWGTVEFGNTSDLPDAISFSHYTGLWPVNQNFNSVPNSFIDIDPTENAGTDYVYTIKMNYDEAYLGTLMNESPTMKVTIDENKDGVWQVLSSNVDVGDNTNQAMNVPTFGRVTQSVAPLPVEYLYFKGKEEDSRITLNWGTATELNSDLFKIQRSYNLKEWHSIGVVKAQGNSTDNKEYSYTDTAPELGANYYRLAQIDLDGKINVSKSLLVNMNSLSTTLNITPIPAFDFLNISYSSPKSDTNCTLKIVNLSGRLVYQNPILMTVSHRIDTSTWPRGTYLVTLEEANKPITRKILLK